MTGVVIFDLGGHWVKTMLDRLIEEELDKLRDKLLIMGGAAEQAIQNSIRALVERDVFLAEHVIHDDVEIDWFKLEIDQMCVDILALKKPDATDLRFVVSTARTAPAIERIAGHTVNIAKHALALTREPELELDIDLMQMSRIVQDMLIAGMDAFSSGDVLRARDIIERDDEVDNLYDVFSMKLVEMMTHDPSTVQRGVRWLSVLKHLERIADYVTNICEQLIYVAQGQVVKHSIW